jgi:hypothetical protein
MRTIADLRLEITDINVELNRICRKYSTKRKIAKAPLCDRINDLARAKELDAKKQVKLLAACSVNTLVKWN